ncbi:protein kinase domain-containing protein [Nannocystis radixulma]|uniref:Tetratricopeptide repeat protein n=1 Tax=Nannocystis radixulma TaxID=2995305 RepID=A0ABT5B6H5_9BACT|nr:tetratricopeptide repeat protein [Nannocystis radixulma]MDC0669714.1 tetratricopeptide repeat protein [Nannocystis radixulma]
MDERTQMSKKTWPEGHEKNHLEETTAPAASGGSVEETVVRPDSLERARASVVAVDVEQTRASVSADVEQTRVSIAPADVEQTTASIPAGGEAQLPDRTLGRYLIIKQLGAGGMGAVFKAYDPDLDRKVAIKLLHGAAVGEARTRLIREAQAMARLSHPNVVPVFDVGAHREDQVFIAMDLVEGTDLRAWIATRRPWTEVVDVFAQAGAGLAAAHAVGLVHRDFKPDNVLLSTDAATGKLRAQVADFGLARRDEEREAVPRPAESASVSALDTQITRYGAIVGTPAYMSPEQHAGVAVDPRTDQFSFCVALFEALYGRRPFTGTTIEELARKARSSQREPPPRGSDVPGWLYRLCLRGLQPDREARYARMDALLHDLQAGRARRQRRVLALGGTLLAAAVAGGTAWAMTGPGVCEGGAARVGEVWHAGRRAAVEAAFTATGLPYAAGAWGGAASLVDRYAEDWKNMYEETCSATQVRGEQSAELMDLRMACLQHRLQDLGALVDLLEHADKQVVKRASEAVVALPGLQKCADVEALRGGASRPSVDPARSEALRERLRAGRAKVSAGKAKDALAELTTVATEAAALDDPSLTAATRLALSRAQRESGDDQAARVSAAAAVWQAVADRDDETLWDALLQEMFVLGYKLGRKADAQPWSDHAEALLRRRGQPDRERAQWLHHVGMIEIAAGESAAAEAPLQEAIELYEKVHGASHPRLANLINSLGASKLRGGKYDEARALFERAVAIAEKSHGPTHPELAQPLNNLALSLERQNRYPEAIAAMQRSRAILVAINPQDPMVGLLRQNIGGMLQLSGKPDEALVELAAAQAHLEEALGPDHPAMAGVFTFIGDARRDLADYPAARAAYERGCEIREKALGADHPELGLCLLGQAQVDLLEQRPADALQHVDRALKNVASATSDPGDLGLMHLARAQALRATGAEAEAMTAAAAAREALTRAGLAGQRGMQQLDAWEAGR